MTKREQEEKKRKEKKRREKGETSRAPYKMLNELCIASPTL
jgi:hypothetical protein